MSKARYSRWPLLMDKDLLAAQLKTKTQMQIAAELGCKPSTVSVWVGEHNLRDVCAPFPNLRRKEWLKAELLHKTHRTIARELGCSGVAVGYWAKRHGLAIKRNKAVFIPSYYGTYKGGDAREHYLAHKKCYRKQARKMLEGTWEYMNCEKEGGHD